MGAYYTYYTYMYMMYVPGLCICNIKQNDIGPTCIEFWNRFWYEILKWPPLRQLIFWVEIITTTEIGKLKKMFVVVKAETHRINGCYWYISGVRKNRIFIQLCGTVLYFILMIKLLIHFCREHGLDGKENVTKIPSILCVRGWCPCDCHTFLYLCSVMQY